ncbi:CLUMA_CG019906, isoform A [Clunio marinus]|uniref:CLUMA_CG019906, isoform A n=1 Tax=Clunio marinus TaxID=568069 RepID=A0A1J1J299_9DIPT|nr:CLUMA_CG019906, isoform A [Clunio marinus]
MFCCLRFKAVNTAVVSTALSSHKLLRTAGEENSKERKKEIPFACKELETKSGRKDNFGGTLIAVKNM